MARQKQTKGVNRRGGSAAGAEGLVGPSDALGGIGPRKGGIKEANLHTDDVSKGMKSRGGGTVG